MRTSSSHHAWYGLLGLRFLGCLSILGDLSLLSRVSSFSRSFYLFPRDFRFRDLHFQEAFVLEVFVSLGSSFSRDLRSTLSRHPCSSRNAVTA